MSFSRFRWRRSDRRPRPAGNVTAPFYGRPVELTPAQERALRELVLPGAARPPPPEYTVGLRGHLSAMAAALDLPRGLWLSKGRLAEFESTVRARIAELDPNVTVVMWGHVGDGNLHVNFVGRPTDDETIDDAVFELVAGYGGSISAEHGIGRAKRRWLHLPRSPADLAAMAAIRHALDPNGVFNPSVLMSVHRA